MEWREVKHKLRCQFVFKDFRETLIFLNKVGELAERQNHHPDFCVSYNKVTFSLWTHETDSVTEKDYKLAHKISELVAS